MILTQCSKPSPVRVGPICASESASVNSVALGLLYTCLFRLSPMASPSTHLAGSHSAGCPRTHLAKLTPDSRHSSALCFLLHGLRKSCPCLLVSLKNHDPPLLGGQRLLPKHAGFPRPFTPSIQGHCGRHGLCLEALSRFHLPLGNFL